MKKHFKPLALGMGLGLVVILLIAAAVPFTAFNAGQFNTTGNIVSVANLATVSNMNLTGITVVATNSGSTNLSELFMPDFGNGTGAIIWGGINPAKQTGTLYGDSTHPGHGEFIVGSRGSMAFVPDLAQAGGTHVQMGQSGAAHENWYWQYDDSPSGGSPLGYSKFVQGVYRWFNGGIQSAVNYPGSRWEAVDTSGNGALNIYFSGLTQQGFGANQTATVQPEQSFRFDGTALNGKLVTGFSALTAVNTTNFPVDYTNSLTVQTSDLFAACFLYETNLNLTNQTVHKEIFIKSGSVAQSVSCPTNWLCQSESGVAVLPTNVPANTIMEIKLTVNCGSTTNTYANVLLSPYTPTFDADAQTFFTAASISDATQKAAVNNLVLSMKADGTWTKCDFIYPLVGGSSNTCSWNLKDTTKYRIAWIGAMTFNANGITGDGSSATGNTQFIPSTAGGQWTVNSSHLSVYLKTGGISAVSSLIHGYGNVAGTFQSGIQNTGTANQWGMVGFNGATGTTLGVITASPTTGLVLGSRTSSSVQTFYVNAQSQDASSTGGNFTDGAVGLLSRYFQGASDHFSSANIAFASGGSGMSAGDVTNLKSDVLAFETTLGRQ